MDNVLPLHPDALARPVRLDLATIEAFMIYPDSEDDREQVLNAAKIEFALENRWAFDDCSTELLALSARTLPLTNLQQNAKDWFVKGMIVGMVLHNQIANHCIGNTSATKGKLIRDATNIFEKSSNGGIIRVSPKTFNNNIWPRYRSVAHYWAASYSAGVIDDYPNGAFPCRLDRLAKFLADAEAYRLKAEATVPKQASSSILDPAETLKLPGRLKIEPSELSFEPIAAEEKTIPVHSGMD